MKSQDNDERAFAALRELGPLFALMGRVFGILGAVISGAGSLDELEERVRPQQLARPIDAAADLVADTCADDCIGVHVKELPAGAIGHMLGEE